MSYDVELRRDRRKEQWLLIASHHAPLARVLAGQSDLRALDGPGGTFALAAVERDAHLIAELLDQVEPMSVEPRAQSWIARATTWHGAIEVAGPPEEPVFLLLGDPTRLPPTLRERAVTAPGGVTVPLTLDSWRVIETLPARLPHRRHKTVRRRAEGRPPRATRGARNVDHPRGPHVRARPRPRPLPARCLRARSPAPPTHMSAAPAPPQLSARAHSSEHRHLPAIRADPFCVEELDRFLADGEVWVEPGSARRAATHP